VRQILDTSILIRHWQLCRTGRSIDRISESDAEGWARDLIKIEDSNAIVTPVLLEFLCGVRDKREMILVRAFLSAFRCLDSGRTLVSDWREARRLAERVPANGRPRDLGDCLIKAIANRLNCGVRTSDAGMPR
jgi:predicted nucleic acid-binding protein